MSLLSVFTFYFFFNSLEKKDEKINTANIQLAYSNIRCQYKYFYIKNTYLV